MAQVSRLALFWFKQLIVLVFKTCFAINFWCIQQTLFKLSIDKYSGHVLKPELHFGWMPIFLHFIDTYVLPAFAKKKKHFSHSVVPSVIKETCDNMSRCI